MSKIYIVGTPIGNLKDITLRAIETLQNVDIIACEDTRVTFKLLSKLNILGKKLITYNAHTESNSAKGIIKLVEGGQNVALVSDAGMPVVSDPGFDLIKLAREKNIDLEIIPGVSAVITAFAGSSFSNNFTFCGFIKDKTIQRVHELEKLTVGTYIYFVSPHKLLKTLEDIDSVFKGLEQLCLTKELTKIYETWDFGTASELLSKYQELDSIKGEFTLVLNIPKVKREKVNKYKK
ncbi:16S rRNA (cytidine(1402)-2'-O)-methyltransferase [Mycoplasma sp. CSL7491-lung]|uniref:16S rRNA (cytidine(1402)-2'-O)-methyltransferase n=1 Tax=Mycoplasma sp. CSL7491-lung TaxID=549718 RepID=UPI001C0FAF5D|nr:16S rRNA (cytidine(1402)-2'-O)-methyltransferase [Mycoplasma sp. CSL7491-lung]MBU4693135.1 16S rRNA (cytidine(1402)-2'-O)-methyltransferase [Mycoplasma sp. CSL7491-lung]